MDTLIFLFLIGAGSTSASESSALLIGMRDPNGPAPWMTPSNIGWAVSDIILGAGLVVSGCLKEKALPCSLAVSLLLVAGNIFRAVEYYTVSSNPFCANKGLLVMDFVKLGLAAASALLIVFRLKH